MTAATRAPRETKEEKKARELRDAYENVYENHDEDALKTKVVDLLNSIDDTAEQAKAQSDAMKDRVDDYKDELLKGSILTIDQNKSRIKILPID
jgi:uncharacterized protein YlxW (UPF0749 family)